MSGGPASRRVTCGDLRCGCATYYSAAWESGSDAVVTPEFLWQVSAWYAEYAARATETDPPVLTENQAQRFQRILAPSCVYTAPSEEVAAVNGIRTVTEADRTSYEFPNQRDVLCETLGITMEILTEEGENTVHTTGEHR